MTPCVALCRASFGRVEQPYHLHDKTPQRANSEKITHENGNHAEDPGSRD